MVIKEYRFGLIKINDKTYTKDVEVCWDERVLDWWRKESHIIDIEDIKRGLEENPEIIVIGTGESGAARVKNRVKEEVEDKGIQLIIDITGRAIKVFNGFIQKEKRVIGFFHLTC